MTADEARMSVPDPAPTGQALAEQVLADVAGLIRDMGVLPDPDAWEILMDTSFRDDLALASVDLVALGGRLQVRYGDSVNFAEYVASLEFDALVSMTVGDLVEHIVSCLGVDSDGQADPFMAQRGEVFHRHPYGGAVVG